MVVTCFLKNTSSNRADMFQAERLRYDKNAHSFTAFQEGLLILSVRN